MKWARSALRKRSHHPSQHAASPARATSCQKTHKLNDVYLDLKRLLSSHRTLWNRLPSKHTRLNDAYLDFRCKYEVEVLVGLHRQPFVRDLLECVQEDGEAVCVSALRAMATDEAKECCGS